MTTVRFSNMTDIKTANRELGHHFFDADTMRFFRSRVESDVIGGRYFITSEQYESSTGERAPRRYTVRVAKNNGDVDTVGEFQAFSTKAEAVAEARRLASES